MTALTNDAHTRREFHLRVAADLGYGSADWPALGTTAHIVVTDPTRIAVAHAVVERVLGDIDLAASRFRDDSELSQLNAAGGEWRAISPLLALSLRVALDAADWTDGLVDPTVGAALIDLGYDRTYALVAPDGPPVVVRVREVPGYRTIDLDAMAGQARWPGHVRVDLGATAKGLAADLAADEAAAKAGCGVLVNLGGDISVAGPAPAAGWSITVADTASLDAEPGQESEQTVAITAGAIATSSVRARRWRRGGAEIHHLINPYDGQPAEVVWRTVSVAASTCVLANTASTAAIIIGADAPTWLESRGVAARLVHRNGEVRTVGGWPTDRGEPV
jgi:thiamine biosynthesis lipoprotein